MGMERALLSAATRGKVDELRQLVARSDAEVLGSVRTPKFDTAVHIAALHGHSRFVSEALSLNRELLVIRNSDGDTPLHLAARAGKERVARLLAGLAQGWTFDASSRDDGPVILFLYAYFALSNRKTEVELALAGSSSFILNFTASPVLFDLKVHPWLLPDLVKRHCCFHF